ncbi:hypothetical protein [Gillisia limnaea]|uniref:Uncharacterized protein n=1 Tax=Gillisia limnaea (strain DSM 15749 / LMG 21470 / R-8282) TaxID=865937 RepID=H2BXR6_GILLR|nr:hypothetical protein [Gillisia limnaea]EHQ02079.1 hypothetical protein Gilli_1422 [Gillisia limnaea DSM 15749]
MVSRINELIDTNLNIICKTKKQEMFASNFVDIEGDRIYSKFESEKFADEMQSRDLIYRINELCVVTEFGYEVFMKGGWLKHLADQKSYKSELELNRQEREKLEIENLKFQNEHSEYQKSIRDKEDQIRNLTKDNLRLGNWDIRFRWIIAIITFITGFLISYLIEK